MYDAGKIIPGLIVFVALVTFPVWYNHGDAGETPKPEKSTMSKECVEDTDFMRTSHMQLLNDWRDNIIRESGPPRGVTVGGVEYKRSLQNGCLKCHTNKEKFCDTCHVYAGVKPYCWDCHLTQETM